MKYTGTKAYNRTFTDSGTKDVKKSTNYKVNELVPGTIYNFKVYGISACGDSLPALLLNDVTTKSTSKCV